MKGKFPSTEPILRAIPLGAESSRTGARAERPREPRGAGAASAGERASWEVRSGESAARAAATAGEPHAPASRGAAARDGLDGRPVARFRGWPGPSAGRAESAADRRGACGAEGAATRRAMRSIPEARAAGHAQRPERSPDGAWERARSTERRSTALLCHCAGRDHPAEWRRPGRALRCKIGGVP